MIFTKKILKSINKDQILNMKENPIKISYGSEKDLVLLPMAFFIYYKFGTNPYNIENTNFSVTVSGVDFFEPKLNLELLTEREDCFSLILNRLDSQEIFKNPEIFLDKAVYLENIGTENPKDGDGILTITTMLYGFDLKYSY